jgi:hypothetical protein
MRRQMCGWSEECLTQVAIKSGTYFGLALSTAVFLNAG